MARSVYTWAQYNLHLLNLTLFAKQQGQFGISLPQNETVVKKDPLLMLTHSP